MTGPKALETGVMVDAMDYVDTAGLFGPKGRHHHLEKRKSFRVHWTAPATGTAVVAKSDVAKDGTGWKAEAIAFNDVEMLVDGQPYSPPPPKQPTQKRSNSSSRPSGYSGGQQFKPMLPSVIRPLRTIKLHKRHR